MFKVDHFLIVPLLIHCSDYSGVSKAYEAMKNVASLINERKRRLESVDTIAHWQVAILHWEVMTISILPVFTQATFNYNQQPYVECIKCM